MGFLVASGLRWKAVFRLASSLWCDGDAPSGHSASSLCWRVVAHDRDPDGLAFEGGVGEGHQHGFGPRRRVGALGGAQELHEGFWWPSLPVVEGVVDDDLA